MKEERKEGGRRIGGDFFERKEKGELFFIVGGDSFFGEQHVLESRERGRGRKKKQKRGFLSGNCLQKEEKR